MSARANRLVHEQSPYLRQHAHNPVDWYPWGAEALDKARREDRPILLSIGYSACHWCHVMERESFENEDIAAVMNRDFVNVKVDREERPDLDTVYMNVVQMLTGAGGWPLTVFLTPQGEPFYGGTYFPPVDRYGRPGFPRVLEAMARAYRDSRGEVANATRQLGEGLKRLSEFEAKREALQPETVARAAEALLGHADREHGGIGGAPKFPNVPVLALFLRRWHATRRPELLDAVTLALTRMARGGIYDQLGGGFHRYSVDAQWLVPHFEKMLYDNAQLVPLYLDAHLATGEPLFRRIAVETLDYVLREMTHPEGGFFSAQDADSEGEEGKFFLWRYEELERLLPADDVDLVRRYYQVDEVGNFAEPGQHERKSILNVRLTTDELARAFRLDLADVERRLARAREVLLAERAKRVWPGRDDKVLTSWNALAIRAFVRAATVLGEPRYLEAALRASAFLERSSTRPGARLLRTWKDGVAKYDAYLDDYAFLAAARLDLFAATGDPAHLASARNLAGALLERFADAESGGFFFTAADHEELIDRPKTVFDGSIPSGNSVAAEVLLRLSRIVGDARYRAAAERTLVIFGAQMEKQPFGTAYLIGVLDELLTPPPEVVIVGAPADERTRSLAAAAESVFVPSKLVLVSDPAREGADAVEILRGRNAVGGRATAYVCRDLTCSPPLHEPDELVHELTR
jgi:uncharacterized protein YyaL (SSP411 family)